MRVGTNVLALAKLNENDGTDVARPGDRGVCVFEGDEAWFPTIRFERTGRAFSVDADTEVVRCGPARRARA